MIYKQSKNIFIIAIIGIILNTVLFGVKLWIGLVGSNIAILSDAFNNLGDVVGSALSAVCFYLLSQQKKYKSFPHGIGRLEQIVSFVMSIIIIAVGGYFFIAALNRLFATLVVFKWTHFIIMLCTVFVKIGMAVMYKQGDKKNDSDILKCAYYDSILDASVTFMTVIGLLLSKYIQLRLDAFFGIIVSTIMVIGGIKLCAQEIKNLLGSLPDDKTWKNIEQQCLQTDIICEIIEKDYHDYGQNEKEFIIKAIFTKDVPYDIIVEETNSLSKKLSQQYNCKIKFVL